MKQRSSHASAVKTHVEIQVIDAEGLVQQEGKAVDLFVPRYRIGKDPNWKRFRLKLTEELPEGAQIRLTGHSAY